MRKGSLDKLLSMGNYDLVLLQEIRSSGDVPLTIMGLGYEAYPFPAMRKGYAGVMSLTRMRPSSVVKGIGINEFDSEGRILTMEFNEFYVINAYFPRAGDDLSRLSFKLSFCNAIEKFLTNLRSKKPIIMCGDFNIARDKIDSSFWDEKHPGLTPEERTWFNKFLKSGYIDTFRELHPNAKVFTWHSYRERWRAMRIDYCIVSEELRNMVKKAEVLTELEGSDHVPVMIEVST